jgi:hypothetical protein
MQQKNKAKRDLGEERKEKERKRKERTNGPGRNIQMHPRCEILPSSVPRKNLVVEDGS